jgi:hypothetical protein
VWNCAPGTTLAYTMTDDAEWLWCEPADGTSSGEHDLITVHYTTAALEVGQYTGTITISDPVASNNPQTIGVTLIVMGQPAICREPPTLAPTCAYGENVADGTFEVWNCGPSGTMLAYAITDDVDWLWCEPAGGTSSGEHDLITVHYTTAALQCGQYAATITISEPAASNNPQTIQVTLTVTCVTGDFDGDGDVDLADFVTFSGCMTGPCGDPPCEPALYPPDCAPGNFDGDGDIDLTDFADFQVAYAGGPQPPEGLIAHWCFDDCTANDCSGHGLNGTNSGAACLAGPGTCASAFEFLESSDRVSGLPSSFDDSITTGFTIVSWVYWYPGATAECISFDARGLHVPNDQGLWFGVLADGRVQLTLYTPGQGYGLTSVSAIPSNEWTCVAGVFDDPADTLRILVNGVEDGVLTVPASYSATPATPCIGNNRFGGAWRPFNGVIDELRIYNRVLNAGELAWVYNDCATIPSICRAPTTLANSCSEGENAPASPSTCGTVAIPGPRSATRSAITPLGSRVVRVVAPPPANTIPSPAVTTLMASLAERTRLRSRLAIPRRTTTRGRSRSV